MPPDVATQSSRGAQPASARRGALALTLQETLTATVRLRANRQVATDAESFRAHIKQLLSLAEEDARRFGYAGESVRLAIYAVVAFLDESVLNSSQPMFASWPRRPLQDELFGDHMAGEIFFQNLRQLLAREDSEDLADLLEVYQLCLLLGFKGRYSMGNPGDLQMLMGQLSEKIRRIRGDFGELSPSWRHPSGEQVPELRDRWARKLAYAAGGALVIAVLLFLVFTLSLHSGAADVRTLATQLSH